jgi:hypothetical protein
MTRPRWRERLGEAGLDEWPLEVLPVLPPDLRAVVPLESAGRFRFAVSDLHELYREVLEANGRLRRVGQLRVPAQVLEIEQDRLETAIAQLFDNAAMQTPKLGTGGRPLNGVLGLLTHPSRPLWPTLAELDGMVARGVVRELAAPLAKRSLIAVWHLRALGIALDVAGAAPEAPATVH